ncbi:unnamed protein product [Bursaphelenchus okinawaensis]|uniref:Uncharacterized protein n=1 Tax=Bursaphelenchus okinawaensis TaxID=465554 RepID=A0A811K854_9BILA|nr:unnamed protein product [Bursaphelenchus okinawaensis]CAG9092911.1 unnamed protein product [Bursaphelenchus okinawaensis]
MRLTFGCSIALKAIILVVVVHFWAVLLQPAPVCWHTQKTFLPSIIRKQVKEVNGVYCYHLDFAENLLCSRTETEYSPWWRIDIFIDRLNNHALCIPRKNVYYSLGIQTAWTLFLQFIHLNTLFFRDGYWLSPLDFVGSFFNLAAFCSFYLIFVFLKNSWPDLWETSQLPQPVDYLDYDRLYTILYFLMFVSALEWLILHISYTQQVKAKQSQVSVVESKED